MSASTPSKRSRRGWLPPRGGGYSPVGNTPKCNPPKGRAAVTTADTRIRPAQRDEKPQK